MNKKQYKYTHRFFLIGLFFKALNGVLEIIGGTLLIFYYTPIINSYVELFTQTAHPIIRSQTFAVLFLLSHGIIKIFLIINLLIQKLWAYPAAIIIFSLFTIYQIHLFLLAYSPWMAILAIFDIIVVALTYLEYRHLKK